MAELFPNVTAEELREQQAEDMEEGREHREAKDGEARQCVGSAWIPAQHAEQLPEKPEFEKARLELWKSTFRRLEEGPEDSAQDIDILALGDKVRRGKRIKPTYSDLERQQREEEDRRYVRVGGWQAGKEGQDHEALRFEIEAERALFLGKPVPTDKELAAKHLELAALHAAYQKSGDPSLLIGIADLGAEYKRMLDDYAKTRNMAQRAKGPEPEL
jgi:hypothetical protein